MVWIEKSDFGITVWHHSASLVMPISDLRDRFFYPHHTPMKDTYCSTLPSDFALYLWLYLIDKHHTLDTFQFHTVSDLIFFIGHCDLNFMVQ